LDFLGGDIGSGRGRGGLWTSASCKDEDVPASALVTSGAAITSCWLPSAGIILLARTTEEGDDAATKTRKTKKIATVRGEAMATKN
jgi:hypothetical protein